MSAKKSNGFFLQKLLLLIKPLLLVDITPQHVCFFAKIFGKKAMESIPFAQITAIEKKTTLGIPNALEISTKNAQVKYRKNLSIFAHIFEALVHILFEQRYRLHTS